MKAPPLSRAALGLFRSLLRRGMRENEHRILLSHCRSTEWRSLTFAGERHLLTIRITGPDPGPLVERMTAGLADAEFTIPGHLVADITASQVTPDRDLSVLVTIEALTISA